MKKCLSILCFCLFIIRAGAQEEDGYKRPIDQVSGTLLYFFQTVNIQGSQFLFDKWMNGKIILNDGKYVDNVKLKYDDYNNKFVVNKNDTAFELSPIVAEVRLYPLADTSSAMVFKKGYSISDKINAKIYLQVLAEGKVGFFRYFKKNLEEYSEYQNANKLTRFNDLSQYYVLVNGQYRITTLSKKNLQDLLSDKWTMVSDYLSKNNLNGKDEKSWQLTIRYYNTL